MITVEPAESGRCAACHGRGDCLDITAGDPAYGTAGIRLCRACLKELHDLAEPTAAGERSEWRDESDDGSYRHRLTVGEFVLTVEDGICEWRWDASWGDNQIVEGETKLTRPDNDQPDAWAHALPRAKAACEEAARKAGIAVPVVKLATSGGR